VTDSAVVDLEKVYNDTITRGERAQAKEERENDVMDEDICLEPLFSASSKSIADLRIQQSNNQQNSNNFQPGPSNVQKHMSQNIPQNSSIQKINQSQRHRNDTLT
jgi:hypothetical protein